MPTLTILTRTYHRPELVARCCASVQAQHCDDYEHLLLVDDAGLGIRASYGWMASHASLYRGRYVYVLDDDGELTDRHFVSDVANIAVEHDPDVIMVRSEHPDLGTLPMGWTQRPQAGMVDVSNYVVRAEVWRQFAHLLASDDYAGDWAFIDALFGAGASVYWHKQRVTRINRVMRGAESEVHRDWLSALQVYTSRLFEPAGRVLYVGANRCAAPTFAHELRQAGNVLDLLELWPPNVRFYEADGERRFAHTVHGDVRTILAEQLPCPHYDAALWWHGPEHVGRDEVAPALARLGTLADLVVVACPWGEWEQGPNDGNPHEVHQCTLYPADLEALGFQTVTLGTGPDQHGQLIAWKGDAGEWVPLDVGGQYDGTFVKLADSYTMWAVDDGRRRRVHSQEELHHIGLRPVRLVDVETLESIPRA